MFDLGIIFILQNIILLMLLLWAISWIGDKFYKAKYYMAVTEVYECGFLSTHSLKIKLSIPFILVSWLLILYDIEFFFLIPFLFNLYGMNLIALVIFWIFWLAIVLSFTIDWFSPAFRWIL